MSSLCFLSKERVCRLANNKNNNLFFSSLSSSPLFFVVRGLSCEPEITWADQKSLLTSFLINHAHVPSTSLPLMENTEQVQDQEPQVSTEDTPVAMDSSIPTPVESAQGSPAATQGETIIPSDVTMTPSEVDSVSAPDQQQQQPQQQSQPSSSKPSVSAPPPQLKRRPRRTGQPLHLLLQDCSKQVAILIHPCCQH
jgi:hypothetical protein